MVAEIETLGEKLGRGQGRRFNRRFIGQERVVDPDTDGAVWWRARVADRFAVVLRKTRLARKRLSTVMGWMAIGSSSRPSLCLTIIHGVRGAGHRRDGQPAQFPVLSKADFWPAC